MLQDHVLRFIEEKEEIAHAIRERAVFEDVEQAIYQYTNGHPERNSAVALFYLGFFDPRGNESHNDAIDIVKAYIDLLIEHSKGIESDPDDPDDCLTERSVEGELEYIKDFLKIRPTSHESVCAYITMKKSIRQATLGITNGWNPPEIG